jgi:hypothetical protein
MSTSTKYLVSLSFEKEGIVHWDCKNNYLAIDEETWSFLRETYDMTSFEVREASMMYGTIQGMKLWTGPSFVVSTPNGKKYYKMHLSG